MKTIFALALAVSALLGFSACESDEGPTVHTTTTTEETVVNQPMTSTSTTVRSY